MRSESPSQALLIAGATAGTRTITVVPRPGVDSIWRSAPTRAARSRIPISPSPSLTVSGVGWIESNAVVLDDERHMVGTAFEHDVHMVCSRVLDDVVQSFLREAIHHRLDLRRQALVCRPARVQLGADAEVFRPVAHVIRQRRLQADILEHRRSQFPDTKRDVFVELPREFLQRFDLNAEVGSFADCALSVSRRQPERGQLLPELIVQLACDSPALVLLGMTRRVNNCMRSCSTRCRSTISTRRDSFALRKLGRAFTDALLQLLVRAPQRLCRTGCAR